MVAAHVALLVGMVFGGFDPRRNETRTVVGEIEIGVAKIYVGPAIILDNIWEREWPTKKDYLCVLIAVKNRSKQKKVHYVSWGGGEYVLYDWNGEWASAVDNLDNRYKVIDFGLGNVPEYRTNDTSIYPQEMQLDMLVFEAPVTGAERLTLKLPGRNVGIDTNIVFEFEMDVIQGTAEYKRAKERFEQEEARRQRERAAERKRVEEEQKRDRAERQLKTLRAEFKKTDGNPLEPDKKAYRVTVKNPGEDDALYVWVELLARHELLDLHRVGKIKAGKSSGYVAFVPFDKKPTRCRIVAVETKQRPQPTTPPSKKGQEAEKGSGRQKNDR